MAYRRATFRTRKGPVRAFLDIPLGRLLKWLFVLLVLGALAAVAGFAVFVLYPVHTIPPEEHVDDYRYLDQGWGITADSAERQAYYYTAQGTSMPQGALVTPLRYAWFTNLEMPFGSERFAAGWTISSSAVSCTATARPAMSQIFLAR